jgi:Domain of unknown function (DUF4062)
MVIRTPDQHLRVFVSSTLAELGDERRAAAGAISTLGLTPVMFEQGARPHPPRDVYRAYLAQSDVFLGLYWQAHGRVSPGMEVSALEEEFELSRDLPRLLYARMPAPDRDPRLEEMISRIRRETAWRQRGTFDGFRHRGQARALALRHRRHASGATTERHRVHRPVAEAGVP